MKGDEQSEAEAEHHCGNHEVKIAENCTDFIRRRHSVLLYSSTFAEVYVYFNELMSITKRYFTSCFNMRSKASLIFWIGMTSMSETMFFWPQ
jgi:CRISPR/Cas system CMR subunit Cmr6 (Cas7 group RAMP superfamily)